MIRRSVGVIHEHTQPRNAAMNRRLLVSLCVLLPLFLSSCSSPGAKMDAFEMMDESQLGTLASGLGMTSAQAQGGLGAILAVAQQRLPVADYQKIAKYIPKADEYLGVARQLGVFEQASTMGTALNSAYSKLGITPDQQAKFIGAVTDYLSKSGGPEVGNLLTGALK
jgi:hypothetical protein